MDTGFSIIVPTYREAKNIPELVQRIKEIDFEGRRFELLLMDDDSNDGTEQIVDSLRQVYPWVKLITRKGKKSLSQSVIDGFHQASYPLFVVMDADLSHPPEKIPEMLAAIMQPHVDFAIGSRYVKNGKIDEVWPVSRKLASWMAAITAKIIIGTTVKDPLSGFLAITKEKCFSGDVLQPIGWKIGLELMVKCQCKKIIEVPIDFSERKWGKSKLTMRVALNYLQHINRLLLYKMRKKK